MPCHVAGGWSIGCSGGGLFGDVPIKMGAGGASMPTLLVSGQTKQQRHGGLKKNIVTGTGGHTSWGGAWGRLEGGGRSAPLPRNACCQVCEEEEGPHNLPSHPPKLPVYTRLPLIPNPSPKTKTKSPTYRQGSPAHPPTRPPAHLRGHAVGVHEAPVLVQHLLLGACVSGAPVLPKVGLALLLGDRQPTELARVQGQQALYHVLLGVVELAHLRMLRMSRQR